MYPVATMCRLLGVSTSGYYAWQGRAPSARTESDEALLDRIREIHRISRGTYGAPRIHAELVDRGYAVGRKRIARLMRRAGLRGADARGRERRHGMRAPGRRRTWSSATSPPTHPIGSGSRTSPTSPPGPGSSSSPSCWTPSAAAWSAGPWPITCAHGSCSMPSTWPSGNAAPTA